MKKIVLIFFVLFSFAIQGAERPKAVDLEPSPDSLQKIKKLKIKSISDLSRLAPFRDVAVIQRRYLPKTFRGELGLSLNGLLNNKFFYSGGLSGELGFFVREKLGFGASGMAFWRMQRAVSKNLQATTGISAFTNAQSRYYGGGYFKWNPVYGKFAFSFLENRIVYFDMFFLLGGGMIYLTRGIDSNLRRALESDTQEKPQSRCVLCANKRVVARSYVWFWTDFCRE